MNQDLTFFSRCSLNRILEVARCSQLTDVGFTTLARVSISLGSTLCPYDFWGGGVFLRKQQKEPYRCETRVMFSAAVWAFLCKSYRPDVRRKGGQLWKCRRALWWGLNFRVFMRMVNWPKQRLLVFHNSDLVRDWARIMLKGIQAWWILHQSLEAFLYFQGILIQWSL